MKTHVINNSDMHFEHLQWKQELLFWKDEIGSFQNRIKEITDRWTDYRVLAEMGQYQHFFGQEEHNINELIHEIDEHESEISTHLEHEEKNIDSVSLKRHEDFGYNLTSERAIYNNLKNRFFDFLYRYM